MVLGVLVQGNLWLLLIFNKLLEGNKGGMNIRFAT